VAPVHRNSVLLNTSCIDLKYFALSSIWLDGGRDGWSKTVQPEGIMRKLLGVVVCLMVWVWRGRMGRGLIWWRTCGRFRRFQGDDAGDKADVEAGWLAGEGDCGAAERAGGKAELLALLPDVEIYYNALRYR